MHRLDAGKGRAKTVRTKTTGQNRRPSARGETGQVWHARKVSSKREDDEASPPQSVVARARASRLALAHTHTPTHTAPHPLALMGRQSGKARLRNTKQMRCSSRSNVVEGSVVRRKCESSPRHGSKTCAAACRRRATVRPRTGKGRKEGRRGGRWARATAAGDTGAENKGHK